MPYAKVIVNPYARGGVAKVKWPLIKYLLKDAGLNFDHAFTGGPGHGTQLARDAVENGYELVVAVGGDGTANEVVNGLVDDNGRGRATLGIISAGTVGDFVHTLGMPRDIIRACRLFSGFKPKSVDLGAVECVEGGQRVRRFYINTAGLGFVTDVVGGAKRQLKFIGGTMPYIVGLIPRAMNYQNKDLMIDIDGRRREERGFVVVVNNGRYLGGGRVFPQADLCDGLLDVAVVGDISRLEALWSFPRFYTGTHVGRPKIDLCKARRVTVDSPQRLPIQIDGDIVGEVPASFWVIPGALDVATGGPVG